MIQESSMAVTPAQIRAARALLGLSLEQLAADSGIDPATLVRAELANNERADQDIAEVARALERAGAMFIAEDAEGAGVRLRKSTAAEGLRPEQLNAANDD